MSRPPLEVVGVGEALTLFEPAEAGPLEGSGRFTMRMAGAEVNLLIGLARLGHRVGLCSAVGDDPFGAFVLDTLRSQGVAVDGVRTDADRPTGVFFKEITGDDRRRVFYYRQGSAAAALASDAVDDAFARSPRYLVVSGLTLGLGGPDGLGATAVAAIRRARAAGTAVVFDANLRPGIWDGATARRQFAELRDTFDLVLAGREELAALIPDTDPIEAAEELVRTGCDGVVVKQGARGSVVIDDTGVQVVPALLVTRPVDPVGAGDAFAAGVVSGLLRGWDLTRAARLGAVLGAEVVASRGDWEGLPGPARAEALLAQLPDATTESATEAAADGAADVGEAVR